MADTNFTWMHSGQIGAPQMNGAAGSNGQMLQVLDACLINGFNPQTVATASKTATTVTLNFGVSHGYIERQLIIVSGATDAALNGKHRVIAKTTDTITIDAIGVAATTGTITTKVAPLDWESIFGSTEPLKRAYRSKNIQSTQAVLYLDMSLPAGHGYNTTNPAKRAMVSVCEDMTTLGVQINSYTDIRNDYANNVNGSLFWYQKRDRAKTDAVTSASNNEWVIVGNNDYFYFFTVWSSHSSTAKKSRDFYCFGDFPSLAGDADRHNCFWSGAINKNDDNRIALAATGAVVGGDITNPTSVRGIVIGDVNGVGDALDFLFSADLSKTATSTGSTANGIPLPNPASQSIVGLNLSVITRKGVRAVAPQLLSLPQNFESNDTDYDLLLSGSILTIAVHYTSDSISKGIGFYGIDMGV